MVLNKIFQPLLTPFTKNKWQSRNPEVRKKAVQELPVSDQETLSQIAMNDLDESIRAIAANKLSDLDLLQTIIIKCTSETVKQTAQNRLFQLLCGLKHPIPEYDIRETMIRGSRNPALLEFVAANADQATLREITIKRINRDPLLGDIALSDTNSQVRQLAARQIAKRSTLERVAKNSRRKDKRVYKIVKTKLDRIIDDEVRPALLAAEVIDICDKLQKLHKRNLLLQEKTTFANYVKRWNEIKNFANKETTEQFQSICSDITNSIDKLEQQKQKEQQSTQILETLLGNLSSVIDELLNAREVEEPDLNSIDTNEKTIQNLGHEFDSIIKTLTDQDIINTYNNKFQAILDLADAQNEPQISDNSLEKLKSFTEQAETMLEKSAFILEKTISALQQKFSLQIESTNFTNDELEQYQQRFNSAIGSLKEKLAIQQNTASQFKNQIENKTKQIKTSISDGQVSKADKSLHELLRQIDKSSSLSISEKQHYHQHLKQIQSELGDLSSWRNWAHGHERENLTHEAEKIAQEAQNSTQLNTEFTDIMAQVNELRKKWKTMRSHTPDELWQRFNNACNLAYERCTPFIEQQTATRQANLEAKHALCEQLEQYIESTGWPTAKDAPIDTSINWIQVDKITKQARKEWSEIGYVDRKVHKQILKRFDHSIAIIREELKKAWRINLDLFYDLINKVEALHETLDDDLPGAIQHAKEYQQQWKKIGPVSAHQRNKIWKNFRSACDVIFAKRQEGVEQKNEQNNERLREKEAICENLEALNQQPLNSKDLENAYHDIQLLWKGLEPKAKAISKEVNRRYKKAKETYYDKLNALISLEQEQQLDLLKQKAELCTQVEAMPDTEEETSTQLQEKWQQLSPLPHSLDSRLNKRFENALSSAAKDKEAFKQKELETKQQFCLKHEILLGIDSPEEDQQARMEMQVELLNSNLGQNRNDEAQDSQASSYELQQQWYSLTNYTQDKSLEKRFIKLLSNE